MKATASLKLRRGPRLSPPATRPLLSRCVASRAIEPYMLSFVLAHHKCVRRHCVKLDVGLAVSTFEQNADDSMRVPRMRLGSMRTQLRPRLWKRQLRPRLWKRQLRPRLWKRQLPPRLWKRQLLPRLSMSHTPSSRPRQRNLRLTVVSNQHRLPTHHPRSQWTLTPARRSRNSCLGKAPLPRQLLRYLRVRMSQWVSRKPTSRQWLQSRNHRHNSPILARPTCPQYALGCGSFISYSVVVVLRYQIVVKSLLKTAFQAESMTYVSKAMKRALSAGRCRL
jgi:hypothetical protein